MARPLKQGLDYFPLDVDFFSDIRIRKLIKYQGGKSISVYVCLLCNIYKEGYYLVWDDELPFIVSEQTGHEEVYIQEVIKSCVNIGLFSKQLWDENHILTSVSIQKRYDSISKLLKRKVIIDRFSLINSEETGVNSEETHVNSEETGVNSGFSTQRKEKKRKENNIPPSPPLGDVVEAEPKRSRKDSPPGNKSKPPDPSLNAKARKLFEDHYRLTFSTDYYWTAKDAGGMTKILQKLEFQRSKKNMDVTAESLLYALRFLLDSISEGWIFENFSVTNINSKFNEIVAKAVSTHEKHGKINSTNSGGRSAHPATDYAAAANAPATFEDACRILDTLDAR